MIFEKKVEDNSIIDGLTFVPAYYSNAVNRIGTLLTKGLILYCVGAGLVGGALSSTKSDFNNPVFNISMILLSVLLSLIYYNKLSSNLGDLLYVFLLFLSGFGLRNYINTGFYSWMNDVIGAASVYFDLDEIGGYATKTVNSRLAMTIAACYIGAIAVMIINLSIIRKMHFLDLVLDIILVMFLPAYLELEPNSFYSTILIIGICISIIWSMSGRFDKIDNQSVYSKSKGNILYNYCPKAIIGVISQVAVVCIIVLCVVYFVFSNDNYSIIRNKSNMKYKTDEVIQIFITSGFAGFFNQYESTAGINSGRLGGIGSVRLDYETDLEVTYVPYSYSPVYLRTFIASDYVPYENIWLKADEAMVDNNEYELLSNNYKNNYSFSAKGKMIIDNIAGEYGEYYTYYSDRHSNIRYGESIVKEFYPLFDGRDGNVQTLTEEERMYWLSIPNDNRPSVMKMTEKLGLNSNMEELQIAQIIKDYYYNNVPYTLRPGATPWKRDFINYFLDKNKKGYCVHFASAATLMFRQMGIPARYVEGYAFSYSDVLGGEIVDDISAEDYYNGYSEIDLLTAVKVDILDANAHAWVEIYTDEYGWIPVELTPPSSDTDIDKESFIDRLFGMFKSSNSQVNSDEDDLQLNFDNTKLYVLLYITVLSIIVLFAGYYLVKIVRYTFTYIKADLNTRLILLYRIFLHINKRSHPDPEKKINYNSSIKYICSNAIDEKEMYKLISILDNAGFSYKSISLQDFEFAKKYLLRKYRLQRFNNE